MRVTRAGASPRACGPFARWSQKSPLGRRAGGRQTREPHPAIGLEWAGLGVPGGGIWGVTHNSAWGPLLQPRETPSGRRAPFCASAVPQPQSDDPPLPVKATRGCTDSVFTGRSGNATGPSWKINTGTNVGGTVRGETGPETPSRRSAPVPGGLLHGRPFLGGSAPLASSPLEVAGGLSASLAACLAWRGAAGGSAPAL